MCTNHRSFIPSLFLILSVSFSLQLRAQCSFDITTKVIAHSTCQANGIIAAAISNSSDFEELRFTISDANNTVINGNNVQFENLAPEKYFVTVTAICKSSKETVSKRVAVEDLTSDYKIPSVSVSNIRQSLNCLPTGFARVSVNGGKGPYTLTFKNYPTTYKGPVVFTINNEWDRFELDTLAAGSYKLEVRDNCTYQNAQSFNITKVASDFPAIPYEEYFNHYDIGCNHVSLLYNSSVEELNYYWQYNTSKYYEVAVSLDNSRHWVDAERWGYYPIDFNYQQIRSAGGAKVYLRLKGTNCESPGQTVKIKEHVTRTSTFVKCYGFSLSFSPQYILSLNYSQWSYLCPPYNWKITENGNVIKQGTASEKTDINVDTLAHGKYIVSITDANSYTIYSEVEVLKPTGNFAWITSDTYRCQDYRLSVYPTGSNWLCFPYTWEVLNGDGVALRTGTRQNNDWFEIGDMPYGDYTLRFSDRVGNKYEQSVSKINPAPPGANFVWSNTNNYSCADYTLHVDVRYSSMLCAPFNWELLDASSQLIKRGQRDDYSPFNIDAVPYGEYKLRFFDDSGQEYFHSISQAKPSPSFSGRVVGIDCNTFTFELGVDNYFCFPYSWVIKDNAGISMDSGTDVGDSIKSLGKFEYGLGKCYNVIITEANGNVVTTHFCDSKSDVSAVITYADSTCTGFNLLFEPNRKICLPYSWRLVDYSSRVVQSGNVDNYEKQTVENVPYGGYYFYIKDEQNDQEVRYNDYISKPSFSFSSYELADDGCLLDFKFSLASDFRTCLPYQWELREAYQDTLVYSGTLEESSHTIKNIPRGGYFQLRIINAAGVVRDHWFFTYARHRELTGEYSTCYWDCSMYGYASFSIRGELVSYENWSRVYTLYPGTRIQFVKGPQNPVYTDITLTDTLKGEYYPFSDDFMQSSYKNLKEGDYEFKISDPCGIEKVVKFTHKNYRVKDFGYNQTKNCDGVKIYPKGTVYYGTEPVYSDWWNKFTNFTMINPDGSTSSLLQGETPTQSFDLSVSGDHQLIITYNGCGFDTVTIHYQQLAYDPSYTAAYACNAESTGQIRIRAKGGTPPYTYELFDENGTSIGIPSTDGTFYEGTSGKKYTVKIKDNCGNSFEQSVDVIDISVSRFLNSNALVCYGDSIVLKSLNLGVNSYDWTGPNGFTSKAQNPVIHQATPENSGFYKISLQPKGCSLFVSDSVWVNVQGEVPSPQIADTIEYCLQDVTSKLTANELEGYTIQWYDQQQNALPSSYIPSADNVGDQLYYVQRTDNNMGCKSEKLKQVVRIGAPPVVDIAASAERICAGINPQIIVDNVEARNVYHILDNEDHLLASQTSQGKDPITFNLPYALNHSADFYVQTVSRTGCAAKDMVKVNVPVTEVAFTTNSLPLYYNDVPYNHQLESSAVGAVYSLHQGSLPSGLILSADGLIAGTVPLSAGQEKNTFQVKVKDESGCETIKEFTLRTCEPAPDVPTTAFEYCMGQLVAPLKASSPSGLKVQWYKSDGESEIDGPDCIPDTKTFGRQVYYVAQVNEELHCVGQKTKVTVDVRALPLVNIVANADRICSGTSPSIQLATPKKDFVYGIFADKATTVLLASLTGKDADATVALTDILLPSDTRFYIHATDTNSCRSAQPLEVDVPVTVLTLTPQKLPLYFHDKPYQQQLESSATGAIYRLQGDLPTGLIFSETGLISGTVPASAGPVISVVNVTVEDSDGCFVSQEYTLRTCEPAPTVPNPQLSYCLNTIAGPLVASSPSGLPLRWYKGDGTEITGALPPSPDTKVIGKQVFWVAQYNEALDCTGELAKIEVEVNPLPTLDFRASAPIICAGDNPVVLISDCREGCTYNIYSDQWLNSKLASGTGNGSTIEINVPTVLPNSSTYYVEVVDALTCSSKGSTPVVMEVVNLEINPPQLLPYKKNVNYEAQLESNAAVPHFSILDGGNLPEGLHLDAQGLIFGQVPSTIKEQESAFTIQVEDEHGCSVSREYTLKGELFVPQVFTPNGDGFNDHFMKGYRLVIFDRLGMTIFEGEDGWDGTYKGKPAAADIYFYRLYYTDENGKAAEKTGYTGLHRRN